MTNDRGCGYEWRSRCLGQRRREAKCLVIPDDLFRVVRGAGRSHEVVVLVFQVGDGGEPVSREGVGIGIRQNGGKGISDGRGRG